MNKFLAAASRDIANLTPLARNSPTRTVRSLAEPGAAGSSPGAAADADDGVGDSFDAQHTPMGSPTAGRSPDRTARSLLSPSRKGVLEHSRDVQALISMCRLPSLQRDAAAIQNSLETIVPSLLRDLSQHAKTAVCRYILLLEYKEDDVVFKQGAPPDAFYFVLSGRVSFYRRNPAEHDKEGRAVLSAPKQGDGSSQHQHARCAKWGDYLGQRGQGQGFGEIAFMPGSRETGRTAAVISDGDGSRADSEHAWAHVAPAVLIKVPPHIYKKEIYPFQARQLQMQSKVAYLEQLLLLQGWHRDKVVQLAYSMLHRHVSHGTTLVRLGAPAEYVYMVVSGTIKVMIPHEVEYAKGTGDVSEGTANNKKYARGASAMVEHGHAHKVLTNTEVALLGANDIFGLIEAMQGPLLRMQRTAICTSDTELFLAPMAVFVELAMANARTRVLAFRLVAHRKHWEELRLQYTKQYPGVKTHLTMNIMNQFANYSMRPQSLMKAVDVKKMHRQRNRIIASLREARTTHRVALEKTRKGLHEEASEVFADEINKLKATIASVRELGANWVARREQEDARQALEEAERQWEIVDRKINIKKMRGRSKILDKKNKAAAAVAAQAKEDEVKSAAKVVQTAASRQDRLKRNQIVVGGTAATTMARLAELIGATPSKDGRGHSFHSSAARKASEASVQAPVIRRPSSAAATQRRGSARLSAARAALPVPPPSPISPSRAAGRRAVSASPDGEFAGRARSVSPVSLKAPSRPGTAPSPSKRRKLPTLGEATEVAAAPRPAARPPPRRPRPKSSAGTAGERRASRPGVARLRPR